MPFFSIVIPQYNRSSKLLRLLKSVCEQNFRDIEICISDGGSSDDSIARAHDFLSVRGVDFTICRTERRAYYDENIRNAFRLAKGKYSLVMGNDDILMPNALESLYLWMKRHSLDDIGVLVTNFSHIDGSGFTMRVGRSMNGASAKRISSCFRNLSFVSGLIFLTSELEKYSTDSVDGSEMYQMYLASCILSNGGLCYFTSLVLVGKDGDDLHQALPDSSKPLPMSLIPYAIERGLTQGGVKCERTAELRSVLFQLFIFIYPYWAYVWSSQHSRWNSIRVYSTLNPYRVCEQLSTRFSPIVVCSFWVVYLVGITTVSLTPNRIINKLLPIAHRIAKYRTRGHVIYFKK